jgi:hypothetical protein
MLLRWFGLLLVGLLAACAGTPGEPPKRDAALPLAADKPTFLWFFTDP